MGRSADVLRTTGETNIAVSLDLDGEGATEVSTGVGFFDHMLSAFGRHGLLSLKVEAAGDLEVDAHHTVEDTGIVIGQALAKAAGSKAGITRFAQVAMVMDEALVLCALDVSGRGACYWDVPIAAERVGLFDTELGQEFFVALAREAGVSLHVRELAGENAHHILEACFKGVGRALRLAFEPDARVVGIPSTKGSL